jgi:predicted Zn-dependent protease
VNEPDDVGESAMRALNAGQPRDARRIAQQAVTDHPERANGWIVLGAANDALGDHAAPLTAYANCSARASGARVAACRALAR